MIPISVNGQFGYAEESELIRTDLVIEDDNEKATSIEYCFKDCPSPIHFEGPERIERIAALQAHKVSCFCDAHVHRSVDLLLKKSPFTSEIHQAIFGGSK